nr:ELKS [Octopus bimaculoides]
MYSSNVSRSTGRLDSMTNSLPNSRSGHHYSSLSSPSKSSNGSLIEHRKHSGGTSGTSSVSSKLLSPRRSRSSGTDSSSQGSRSSSPLDMSTDSIQSVNSAYNLSQSYVLDGHTSPIPSLYDSRSSSMTSVRSFMRDRSLERNSDIERMSSSGIYSDGRSQSSETNRYPTLGTGGRDHRDLAPTSSGGVRERRPSYQLSSSSSRDRSLDREYPHMGARSLERDYAFHHNRNRSFDMAEVLSSSFTSQSVMDVRLKDQIILDLQNQIAELNRDCLQYQRDAENSNEKLNSCMNSIKTFWSPELKKERAQRKEEVSKYLNLNEQLKITQAEFQRQSSLGKELQLQLDQTRQSVSNRTVSEEEMDNMKYEQDKQNKELVILRKTVEEMEIRIATQKQTLAARDESIKKLLEMLQSKGLMVKQIDADRVEMETLRNTALEEETKRRQLELVLEEKAKELSKKIDENGILSNQLKNAQFQMQSLPANAHTMQAMLEAKDSRISALEKDIQLLEDKLLTLQEDISIGDRSMKHSNLLGSKEMKNSPDIRTLKTQVDRLHETLGCKETELCGLRLQLDTSEKQYSEQQEYALVLKEQIVARDHQISNITSEIDELRSRIKDKDLTIEKKSKQVHSAQRERKKSEADAIDLRDSLDIKERKINVLQRKIQTLEDELQAKELQLKTSQARLASAASDSDDKALSSLEESLAEKDRLVNRLREQRERIEKEFADEINLLREQNEDYKKQIDHLNTEINDKQTQMCELREEASELRSKKIMSESMVNQLKIEMSDTSKEREIEKLTKDLEKMKEERNHRNSASSSLNSKDFNGVDSYHETTLEGQSRLKEMEVALEEANKEKAQKDVQMKELQDQIKEYKQKMGTLKRNQQTEKKKNAQMLEEARKREVLMDGDASQLKNAIKHMDDRVEELEEALRESVTITAEREMVMAEQESKIQQTEAKVYELTAELEKMKSIQSDHIAKVGALTRQLEEKDAKLRRLVSERHKQLEEVYEMKQEAIQATISEKDANIALLEMTSTKKQRHVEDITRLEKEKEKLAQQLKELTETRMRLLQKKKEPSTTGSQKSLVHRMKGATDEQVIRAVRKIEHSKKRLRTLIDQLLAAVLDTDPQLLEGLPRIQQGPSVSVATLRTLSSEEVRLELHKSDRDCQKLQDYANILLQRVGASYPELLDNFVSMMESSDTESCQST